MHACLMYGHVELKLCYLLVNNANLLHVWRSVCEGKLGTELLDVAEFIGFEGDNQTVMFLQKLVCICITQK